MYIITCIMKSIALLTDFGLEDNFVGVMKGVILSINPHIRIIDISHAVAPQDIFQAGFLLNSCFSFFPKKTIFLVVVDPGVGSKRKPIIIKTKNYFFIGPDNGVLSLAANRDTLQQIHLIENERYILKPVSHTFHGRDIFSPVAAYISKNKKLSAFGKQIHSIKQIKIPKPIIHKGILQGKIIYIDRFGNLVTNINKQLLIKFKHNAPVQIILRNKSINSVSSSYQSVKPGKPLAVFGSFGFLEIAINRSSAEKYFNAKKNDVIQIS